jgi:hypothetical protein
MNSKTGLDLDLKLDLASMLENMPDDKVNIYVETANEIFELCFKKAELLATERKYIRVTDKSNKNAKLVGILDQTYKNHPIKESFLRNKAGEIKKELALQIPHNDMGFDRHLLFTLSFFAGIDNFMIFDKKFGPVESRPVLFWPKPFRWYNLIRVPRKGVLNEQDTDWEYIGDDKQTIKGSITSAGPFTMDGDGMPLWIQVKYTTPNGPQTAYFAGIGNPKLETVTSTNGLLRFFKRTQAPA